MDEAKSLAGLELLSIASGLFREGDSCGYAELLQAIVLLAERRECEGICASAWILLHEAGWLGDLKHCWHCGEHAHDTIEMYWQSSQLLCDGCGKECGGVRSVSAGLRRSITGVLAHDYIRLAKQDARQWRGMIALVLREHGVKVPESFQY